MVNFIEFPIFTGVSGDLRPWISWLEAFFVREKFKKLEKMNLAQSLLAGEAEAWFYLIQKTLIFYSWRELKEKLLLRFGDVADSDRIRLIAEQDRFLMEIRDEARIRRRKTTSIPVKDTIRETITVVEETSEIVDGNLAERASEKKLVSPNQVTIWDTEPEALIPTDTIPVINLTESRDSILATKSIQEANSDSIKKDESHEATLVKVLDNLEEASVTQNQVPVSKLEPSLQIPKDSPNVCENSQAVVGCEHPRSFQKNIRMDVVNGVVERSQRVMSITKNVSAHQVLDKTSAHKERLKPKSKRKLSLSLKTWKFKFKNKNLQRNWSQMDLHPVIDRSKANHLLCFSANFGLVRNRRTFQCLRLTKQAHKSRVLYQLRWLHDPGGKKDEHFDEIFEIGVDIGKVQRTQMDIVAESVITAPDNVAPSKLLLHSSFDGNKLPQSHKLKVDKIELQLAQSDITLVGLKVEIASLLEVNCVLADCLMHKATVISATLYSLFSFEVDIEAKMSSGLSPTSQVWEPGGVVAANVLVDWFMDFIGSDGIVAGIRCLGIGVCSGINQPIDSRRASRVWERGGLNISAGLTDWLMKCYKGFEFSRLMRKLPKIDLQWVRRKDWAELCVGHGLLVSWCGWMVFDRGKNKLILRDVPSEVIEALAKHCPQLTDLGFLDCLNHAMRGSNTSSHNLVHLMWQLKSQTLILLSLRILLHRFIVCGISRPLGCVHRSLSPISYSQA